MAYLAAIPFLNAGSINAAFSGVTSPRLLALRNVNIEGLRPQEADTPSRLNILAMYIYLDSTQATGITPQGYELAYRYYQETCNALQEADVYLDQDQARDHVSRMFMNILQNAPSRSTRAMSQPFVEDIRELYITIQGLPQAARTYQNDAGADVEVALAAPPAVGNAGRDWGAWAGVVPAEDVVGFLTLAAGMTPRRCNARMVDWLKGAIVYIWYTLMFAGTSNARKFSKFVGQCGLSQMECPWPSDVGVLGAMYNKMTLSFDRARFTRLFDYMTAQGAVEVLGLKNMVAQGRYHGMTAIMMIYGAMKECPEFGWMAVYAMWGTECDTFAQVLNGLIDRANNHVINPWGGFGTSDEKNTIRSTQFPRLAQLAYDIQIRFMGNVTISNLASFKTRAIYGKWANTVDGLMDVYETWVNNHMNVGTIMAGVPAQNIVDLQAVVQQATRR